MKHAYCKRCGHEVSEVELHTCTCGQRSCRDCHEGSALHLKHERDYLYQRVTELQEQLRRTEP